MALSCLEKYVLPILVLTDEFIALRNNKNFKTFSKLLVTLCILNHETGVAKCKDMILAYLSQDQLDSLCMHLKEAKTSECNKINKCKPVADLLIFRIKFLEEKINDQKVSWVMNGSLGRRHQEVETFLNNNK